VSAIALASLRQAGDLRVELLAGELVQIAVEAAALVLHAADVAEELEQGARSGRPGRGRGGAVAGHAGQGLDRDFSQTALIDF